MKLALLIIGVFATGLATLVFFCLAVASSWAAEMGETLQNPETNTPPESEQDET